MSRETTVRTAPCCYLSTPEHVRSFVGRFIYIYTDKGELWLTRERLSFRSASSSTGLDIALGAITDIALGHYSRWAKPLRLDYLAVHYADDDEARTVLLTPTHAWTTPVWQTNQIVAAWAELISDLRAEWHEDRSD
jgi:hypothetical protein